jgi:quercetin dioxygenase-like cupin family protein
MSKLDSRQIEVAEVVFPCENLAENLAFFTDTLGFRIESIYPADTPRIAVVSAYGTRLRLEEKSGVAPNELHLTCRRTEVAACAYDELVAPNGTRVKFEATDIPPVIPDLLSSLTVQKVGDQSNWVIGRAGMQYRDLIPDRLGGRYIASHIRIPEGGPVSDYVHHHHILFQLIYCYKGWVRVVYEDQGAPFLMHPGDCVLQPPHIRHEVLECSEGFEVVEISCPAEHVTLVDHDMALPTEQLRPDRDFGGQRFSFHQAVETNWSAWRADGFDSRDFGFVEATGNIVSAGVVRAVAGSTLPADSHQNELLFNFVLQGSMTIEFEGNKVWKLQAGDSCTIPAGMDYSLSDCSTDLEFLEVLTPN